MVPTTRPRRCRWWCSATAPGYPPVWTDGRESFVDLFVGTSAYPSAEAAATARATGRGPRGTPGRSVMAAAETVTRLPRERRAEARIVSIEQLLFHPRDLD